MDGMACKRPVVTDAVLAGRLYLPRFPAFRPVMNVVRTALAWHAGSSIPEHIDLTAGCMA